MSDFGLGNLYDYNKTIVKEQKPLTKNGIKNRCYDIASYFEDTPYNYFMLLCREKYDFTTFNRKDIHSLKNDSSFITDLKECLTNRGKIKAIDPDGLQKNTFEIWIEPDGEDPCAYYFFPCDDWIIENREE